MVGPELESVEVLSTINFLLLVAGPQTLAKLKISKFLRLSQSTGSRLL